MAGEDTSQGGGSIYKEPRINIRGYPAWGYPYSTPPGLYLPFQNVLSNFTGFLFPTQNSKLKTQNSKLKTQNSKLKTQNRSDGRSKLKTQQKPSL
ncbi:hypothetical protein QE390_004265 [Siphonobacter sp. SORGH_AS 1065]|nr:hypothetical protein [Siphonobacter sp. SORGH_AS_1065]